MEIKDLVIDDRERGVFRVHRSTMTSQEIFERERQQIFDRCWIYLGHESEVEKPATTNGATWPAVPCSSFGATMVRFEFSSTPALTAAPWFVDGTKATPTFCNAFTTHGHSIPTGSWSACPMKRLMVITLTGRSWT